MRELNAFEKKIAKKIANSNKIRIEGLFTPSLLDKFALVINLESNDVDLYFDREKIYEEDKETIKEQFFMELIFITSLIKLFEKEGYLYSFYLDFPIESLIYIGLKKIPKRNTEYKFSDKNAKQLLVDYVSKDLYPTKELKFYTLKFRTRQAKRHRQILVGQWVVIILALLFGLYGIWDKCKDYSIFKSQYIELKNEHDNLNDKYKLVIDRFDSIKEISSTINRIDSSLTK